MRESLKNQWLIYNSAQVTPAKLNPSAKEGQLFLCHPDCCRKSGSPGQRVPFFKDFVVLLTTGASS